MPEGCSRYIESPHAGVDKPNFLCLTEGFFVPRPKSSATPSGVFHPHSAYISRRTHPTKPTRRPATESVFSISVIIIMNRQLRSLVGLLGRSPAWQSEQKRFLNIHEYQGAELMASYGINVPRGIPVTSLDQVAAATSQLAGDEVVVKSQILAGGRGLGTFKSGFQGGVHLVPKDKAVEVARKMLGGTLVTKQTGPGGRPVNTLLIAEKMNLKRETYFSIVLDRKTAGPMMIACAEGGTSIEDLAATSPEKIIRIPVDIRAGIRDEDAMKAVEGLEVTTDKKAAAEQIKRLYNLFVATDATMLEVNPLAETSDGLLAADAKLGFDDSAEFRQPDLFAMVDESQQDPREAAAAAADLNFIALDGSIGCLVNGT